tara:strand:- start:403 stop:1326 length:924 start_codon:yes stop_codon:yes gene_type:complete
MLCAACAILALPDPTARALVDAVVAQREDVSLERFFSRHNCSHVYLDVGTNLGVQIRKLAEPHKYTGAPILGRFRSLFGSPPWCHVCAVGFEPNPAHHQRLDELRKRLRAASAPPFYLFRAAASGADSAMGFLQTGHQGDHSRHKRTQRLKLAGSLESGADAYNASRPRDYVPMVDLARVVHTAHTSLMEKHNGQRAASKILMKLDVEGSENSILLHLVRSQALCLVDSIQIEWHNAVPDWIVPSQGDAGVSMLANVTMEVQRLFQRLLSATQGSCRTRLDEFDDETFYKDGQRLPSEAVPICQPSR